MDDDEFAKILADAAKFDRNVKKEKNKRKRKMGIRPQDERPKKTFKQASQEARKEGLEKKIPKNNIGFKLLQKMGYKDGMALGKTYKGRIEPVGFTVKEDAGGLGKDAQIKRRHAMKAKLAETLSNIQSQRRVSYRSGKSAALQRSMLKRSVLKMQDVCMKLDQAAGVNENPEGLWMEPPKPAPKKPEPKPDSVQVVKDTRPPGVNDRNLERFYNEGDRGLGYCEACEDDAVLSTSGPAGPLESLLRDAWERQRRDWAATAPTTLLDSTVRKGATYMRRVHKYCFWCCSQYKSEEELKRFCPGPEEEEHDVGALDSI